MHIRIAFIFILLFVTGTLFSQEKNTETGKASYYAKKMDNRKTASGELYFRDDFVCAHKNHPFGTLLVVRNPLNNKKVLVKVIDRGPFHKGRVIDLSYAAAKKLDILRHGVATVEILSFDDSLINFRKHLPDSALFDLSNIMR